MYSNTAIAIATSSASLSAISSAIIVTTICRSQVRLSSVYNRIIFGMSIFDIIGSVSVAFTTIPMPVDQIYPFSHTYGTVVTCEVQGFAILVAFGACMLYSAGLSFFHLCLIKFKLPDKNIRKVVEPVIHVVSLTAPLCVGVSDPSCRLELIFLILHRHKEEYYLESNASLNDHIEHVAISYISCTNT